ncbi:MAG: hypothetical protein HQL19_02940, partial [Candidatus Omnitrophica bacterium]|nr:hypothetical protein [Candidatus Omnitrophota bacterium]
NDIIAFLGSRGCVIAGHQLYQALDGPVIGIQYNPARNRLLLWTKNAIGVIDLSLDENDAKPGERVPGIKWVFDKGRDIRQCFWAYGASHVLFRDGNNISILEPVPQGPAHVEYVTAVRENTSVLYAESKGMLYYLGKDDGKLYALDIIPRAEIGLSAFMDKKDTAKGNR